MIWDVGLMSVLPPKGSTGAVYIVLIGTFWILDGFCVHVRCTNMDHTIHNAGKYTMDSLVNCFDKLYALQDVQPIE